MLTATNPHPGAPDHATSKFIGIRKTSLAWYPCAVPTTGPSSCLSSEARLPCHTTSAESGHINIYLTNGVKC